MSIKSAEYPFNYNQITKVSAPLMQKKGLSNKYLV